MGKFKERQVVYLKEEFKYSKCFIQSDLTIVETDTDADYLIYHINDDIVYLVYEINLLSEQDYKTLMRKGKIDKLI